MLPGAFFVPVLHSWVKARMSARLGDLTPEKQGFLSGSPFKYFEIIGFVLMLMFGFGWGQVVPTSALHYKDRQKGILLTHITPSVVSLLAGVIAALLYAVLFSYLGYRVFTADTPYWMISTARALLNMLNGFARLSVGMAFFALIPVHPLNGARILQLYLTPELVAKMNQYEKIFQIILIIAMVLGFVGILINPLIHTIVSIGYRTGGWIAPIM
jgi:Zn-dependent protease